MPTYEYRCSAGHQFEQFQRMSEPPLATCTLCGAPAERLLSAGAGLLFKGSGFYITDYRSDAYRKAADAEKGGGASKPEGGGPAEGGTKPAAKPDAGSGDSASGGKASGKAE